MGGLSNLLSGHLVFRPRDSAEAHRAATPLELFFDLVSVIAIAAAAAGLHHAVAEGHAMEGLLRYLLAFFAIWWAWMNYTWFASAYDDDSVAFRLLTMVIMFGALIMAAGQTALFTQLNLTVVILGYVVMRVGMIVMWLGAARGDAARATTAKRYAAGIGVAQIYWLALPLLLTLGLPLGLLVLIGVALELAVPAFAERAAATPWHRHHIVERYGLLTIIVLGEALLAGSVAISTATTDGLSFGLIWMAFCGVIITFALWWLYFCKEDHLTSPKLSRALAWGYGHYIVFGAGAAVGAGLAVQVELATHHAHTTQMAGDMAVALPMAAYLLGLWLVRDRHHATGTALLLLPAMAVVCVICAVLPFSMTLLAVAGAATVWLRNHPASPAYING
tara:strand:+ start:325 stop:1497 length:1173 start_codon:yes stop_codon:yes gene_type:complete